jgi:ELWxxDGT repeat protein
LFTVFNNNLYFVANSNGVYALWKYDGTNVTRAATNTIGAINAIVQYNGALYMGAVINGTDVEPCKFDGTNFTQIAEISLVASNASPVFWANYHGSTYFSADDGVHGQQLYSYDGTKVTLMTPAPFVGGFYLFPFNDAIYFMGKMTGIDYEMWKYDGTTVSQVADINPGASSSLPTAMSPFRNSYMFYANDGTHGTELWRLDGLSDVFRLTGAARQGSDVSISWLTPGGWTNVLQSSDTLDGGGNFTDLSGPLVSPNNGGLTTTNFTDVGGAVHPSRYYRLRVGP